MASGGSETMVETVQSRSDGAGAASSGSAGASKPEDVMQQLRTKGSEMMEQVMEQANKVSAQAHTSLSSMMKKSEPSDSPASVVPADSETESAPRAVNQTSGSSGMPGVVPLVLAGILGALLALMGAFVLTHLPQSHRGQVPEFVDDDVLGYAKRGQAVRMYDLREMSVIEDFPYVMDEEDFDYNSLKTNWALVQKTAMRNCSLINTHAKSKTYFYKSAAQNLTVTSTTESAAVRLYRSLFRDVLFKQATIFRDFVSYMSMISDVQFDAPVRVLKAKLDGTILNRIYFVDALFLQASVIKNCVLRELLTIGALDLERMKIRNSVIDKAVLEDVRLTKVEVSDSSLVEAVVKANLVGSDLTLKTVALQKLDFLASIALRNLKVTKSSLSDLSFSEFVLGDPIKIYQSSIETLSFARGLFARSVVLRGNTVRGVNFGGAFTVSSSLDVSKSEIRDIACSADSVLHSATLANSVFSAITFDGSVTVDRALWKGVSIENLKLMRSVTMRDAKISTSSLTSVQFLGVAQLKGVLTKVRLGDVSVTSSLRLTHSSLNSVQIDGLYVASEAVLGADLVTARNVVISNSTIDGFAIFDESQFTSVEFVNVVFNDMASFEDAVLTDVKFTNVVFKDLAIFEGSKLTRCTFTNVLFERPVKSRNAKLRKTKFVDTVFPEDGGFIKEF